MPECYECPLVLDMLRYIFLWMVGKQINLFVFFFLEENKPHPDSIQKSAAVGLTLKREEKQLWKPLALFFREQYSKFLLFRHSAHTQNQSYHHSSFVFPFLKINQPTKQKKIGRTSWIVNLSITIHQLQSIS